LNQFEFDRFITNLSLRAPFSGSLAWQIIRLASTDNHQWFIKRGSAPFQRKFHQHPTIAPLLLEAAIRAESRLQDTIALFDYYHPVASGYQVLRDALPLWRAELERRELERRTQEEQEMAERARQEQIRSARLLELNRIQYDGPTSIIRALADAHTSSFWDFPENWARIQDLNLRNVPLDLLKLALENVSRHLDVRCWRCLAHKILAAIKTVNRSGELADLERHPFSKQLEAACNSKWSLTYFPDCWGAQIASDSSGIQPELRSRLLSKLMRVQRRCSWRVARRALLCQH
jgi:hypothetical protein